VRAGDVDNVDVDVIYVSASMYYTVRAYLDLSTRARTNLRLKVLSVTRYLL
jgi:hypothetical protein